jgi:hypothetical protein
MKLAFHEQGEDITGLKKIKFIEEANKHINTASGRAVHNLWVSQLYTDKGIGAGWFCNFLNSDGHEYHLQTDRGIVRVFKTIDAAVAFYSDCDTCTVSVGWG